MVDPLSSGNVIPESSLIECYVSVSFGDPYVYSENAVRNTTMRLPCYPDSVSDTMTALWQTQQVIGRTSPVSIYSGADDRKISFSMKLHRDMRIPSDSGLVENTVDDVITLLRSGIYPIYVSSGLYPPVTTFKFGDLIARGKLESVSINWQPPIVAGGYKLCDVSISLSSPSVYNGSVLDAEDIRAATTAANPFDITGFRESSSVVYGSGGSGTRTALIY